MGGYKIFSHELDANPGTYWGHIRGWALESLKNATGSPIISEGTLGPLLANALLGGNLMLSRNERTP